MLSCQLRVIPTATSLARGALPLADPPDQVLSGVRRFDCDVFVSMSSVSDINVDEEPDFARVIADLLGNSERSVTPDRQFCWIQS